MGDSMAANLFMLGYAWQHGRIPVSEAALLRAIELNGVAIESNKKSFLWGRRAAVDFKRFEPTATPTQAIVVRMPHSSKGRLVKAEFGAWTWTAFKLLAKFKGLRGGALDIFGYTEKRKMERALIVEYRDMVEGLLAGLTAANVATAIELASLPEQVRGFGHVKEAAVVKLRAEKARLLGLNTVKQAA